MIIWKEGDDFAPSNNDIVVGVVRYPENELDPAPLYIIYWRIYEHKFGERANIKESGREILDQGIDMNNQVAIRRAIQLYDQLKERLLEEVEDSKG